MRIGILTASLASNIGGIMQNYALQNVLLQMGHSPITIDVGKRYTKFRWVLGRIRALFTGNVSRVPFPWYDRIGSYRILKFVMKNIIRTRFVTGKIEPQIVYDYQFDAIIVGSDQVWRKEYNANLYNMFLDFVKDGNVKKISYAASLGVEKWDYDKKQTEKCKLLASDFTAISVRELSDVKLCKDFLGINAVHVLDPTLLLDKSDYMKLCENILKRKEKFLFAYILDMEDEKIEIVKSIADELGLKYILMSSENNLKESDSIEEWLSFYRDSSFVITDSYHGTLFSIIFNKEFLVFPNRNRGMSRFRSILELLRLENRVFYGDTTICQNMICWKNINSILKIEKYQSKEFLRSVLN